MSSEDEIADSLPLQFDAAGLQNAFKNPEAAFRALDLNQDGRITTEDLQLLLEKFGIKGMPGKFLAKLIFKQLDSDKSGTITASDLTHADSIVMRVINKKKSSAN